MTYRGHKNELIKSSYSLTLFEAYFRDLLGALPPSSASFWIFFVAVLFLKNFIKLYAVYGWHFWIFLNSLKYIPFYSHCMHVLTIMLIFDQELGRSTDINLSYIFVFCPIFRSSHEVTIKPINRTKGILFHTFTTWYYVINNNS